MVARYDTLVYACNRTSGTGIPVSVIASSSSDAVQEAIKIGWNGRTQDARVLIRSVFQEDRDTGGDPYGD